MQLAAAGCAPPFLQCENHRAAQPCSVWALAGCSFACRCSWDGLSSPRAAGAITVNCQMQLLGHLIDLYLKCPLEREPSGDAGNVKMINPLLPSALLQNLKLYLCAGSSVSAAGQGQRAAEPCCSSVPSAAPHGTVLRPLRALLSVSGHAAGPLCLPCGAGPNTKQQHLRCGQM